MLELGSGTKRRRVRDALLSGRARVIRYQGVLSAEDIREALAGVREAGSPEDALPLLAWLASHPNTPEDAQRDLLLCGPREVCMSLCLNPSLHEDLHRQLLDHTDEELRQHAHHVFSRTKRH
jgi:hypothetical protein